MRNYEQWNGFGGRTWKEEINVRDFIQKNYKPYDGNEEFLAGPTENTNKLWDKLQALQKEERAKGGVLDMDTKIVSTLTSHKPGYIGEDTKDMEKVVGLQTDKPLKRAFMPFGGIKMAEQACETYGYTPDPELHKIFTEYSRTHNQGVFDAYTPEMKKARHNKIITGLPDTYGRGRIVGDYRRVALYGIDALIEEKKADFANCGDGVMTDNVIRQREELTMQINALKGLKCIDYFTGDLCYAYESEGSVNDMSLFADILMRMQNVGLDLTKTLLATDRGYASILNIQKMINCHLMFLTGMTLKEDSIKNSIDRYKDSLNNPMFMNGKLSIYARTADTEKWTSTSEGVNVE